jgi:hypothetical protein
MASATYMWDLEAFEQQGRLWLKWSTNAPFRAQQGQIHVYKASSFPSDPTKDTEKWSWDNENKPSWDTGLPWGTNWYCAYIAEASPNGPYVYMIKLVTNNTMGPDVAKK